MTGSTTTKVLVVDDSFTVQLNVRRLLEADPAFEVIGTASTGEEAIEQVRRLAPDVVTMDIQMAQMDGIEATRAIMSSTPLPILILSSYGHHPEWSVKALAAGALEVMDKPPGMGHDDWEASGARLRGLLKQLAGVRVVRRWSLRTGVPNEFPPVATRAKRVSAVFVGASTGGPAALLQLLKPLTPDFKAPILVVQHIAAGFGQGLVRWLDDELQIPVCVPVEGDSLCPGRVYIAPDDRHMGIGPDGRIVISKAAPESGLRPAVSFLFRSAEQYWEKGAVGILLTGMGKDGAVELAALRKKGAFTMAQDKESSVVHGMPGEAIRLNGASVILPPNQMAEMLVQLSSES